MNKKEKKNLAIAYTLVEELFKFSKDSNDILVDEINKTDTNYLNFISDNEKQDGMTEEEAKEKYSELFINNAMVKVLEAARIAHKEVAKQSTAILQLLEVFSENEHFVKSLNETRDKIKKKLEIKGVEENV